VSSVGLKQRLRISPTTFQSIEFSAFIDAFHPARQERVLLAYLLHLRHTRIPDRVRTYGRSLPSRAFFKDKSGMKTLEYAIIDRMAVAAPIIYASTAPGSRPSRTDCRTPLLKTDLSRPS